MHDWMTSRHEGCVSTMLTDKRLKYCTAGAPVQGSGATKWMMQADKHGVSGVFRLDSMRARVKLQREVIDTLLKTSGPSTGTRSGRNIPNRAVAAMTSAPCNPSFVGLHLTMIRSFKSKKLRRFFEADDAAGLPAGQAEKIGDILAAIETAEQTADIALFPGWRLHPLKGELKGFWSVTITGNWRVIFRFEDGDAFDVDLVDYH
jgi:proteic killer suppression protein